MGRYTTVQAYADNNANMRSVSYEQATGSSESKKAGVKADKVVNPYGSTAGAGSGEFHIYRHARSREMSRIKQLTEQDREKQLDAEFEAKISQYKTEEERKTARRRRKRQREKEAKSRKKNMKLGGVGLHDEDGEGGNSSRNGGSGDEEEFEYTPIHACSKKQDGVGKNSDNSVPPVAAGECGGASIQGTPPTAPFANDGSFLEMMKKKMAEEAQHSQQSSDKASAEKQNSAGASDDDERPAKKRGIDVADEEKKEVDSSSL